MKRDVGDEESSPDICRDCLRDIPKGMFGKAREDFPLPAHKEIHQVPADVIDENDEVLWNHWDTAFALRGPLYGIKSIIESGSGTEQLSYSLDGGPADEPPTLMNETVARIQALLTHNHYEVNVTTGIDRDLAASGRLGRFHAACDVDQPRWVARIEFQKPVDVHSPEVQAPPD